MSRGARRSSAAAVLVAVACVAGAAWLYRAPFDYQCAWGTNPQGAAHFARVLGVEPRAADAASFRAGLALTLGGAWAAYLAMFALGLGGRSPSRRLVLALACATGLALAVVGPPALSPDVYAYVGYARLAIVHHLNPYVETQATLARLADPTAPFLRWPIASPYGPLWTWLSMAVTFVFPAGWLWAPVVAFKLMGAAAVLALAEGGRRLAARLSPGREDLALAALALNPLFLLEGVVNGHNDVVMAALVVWSLVLAREEGDAGAAPSPRPFLLLGLAAAIKFVPWLLAPWLLVAAWRRTEAGGRGAMTVRAIAASVLPVVVCYAPFWRGWETLAGLQSRAVDASRAVSVGGGAGGALIVLAAWGALTPWVARAPLERAPRGWVVVSLLTILLATGMWFPWYFVWPTAVALTLLRGTNLLFVGFAWGASLVSLLSYLR
jgi:hypothetical protein